ncbi:MAG TPA: hypothetical protein VH144_01700 [Candidatus Saccharimonadales bacterium]|jgi:hypothetical protein|nr:hypothetical protein [Candidatus Saccharimonadales bacterium]
MNATLPADRLEMVEALYKVAPEAVLKEINCELRIECHVPTELAALHKLALEAFDFELETWLTVNDRRYNFYYQSKTASYPRLEVRFSGTPAHFVLLYWYWMARQDGVRRKGWLRFPHHSIVITDPTSDEAVAIRKSFRETHVDNDDIEWRPNWFPMF